MFDSLNKEVVNWEYPTEGFSYVKCSTLIEGQVYPVHGFFVTPDNGYGKGAVAIMDSELLNMPQSCVEQVEKIVVDKAMVSAIKNGHCGIMVRSYTPKRFPNKKGYAIDFKDI